MIGGGFRFVVCFRRSADMKRREKLSYDSRDYRTDNRNHCNCDNGYLISGKHSKKLALHSNTCNSGNLHQLSAFRRKLRLCFEYRLHYQKRILLFSEAGNERDICFNLNIYGVDGYAWRIFLARTDFVAYNFCACDQHFFSISRKASGA